ncbi:unnamed protein product [Closterium sp. NIES-65]|nr:unnamed protein product [Closterium sp. NIES-65]
MKTGNGKFTFLLLVLLAIHASLASLEEARTPVVNPSQYEIFLQRNGEVPEDQRRQHTAEGILDAESSEEVGGRRVLVDTGVKFGLSAPPLNSGPSMATVNMSFYRWESVTPPPVVDWRKTVAMTAIQTHLDSSLPFLKPLPQCSSCWAISAVDSIAMMWAIANNSTGATLSPQQVCDCATKQCCQGGWPEWAFYYVLFNGGITYNVSYPYSAVDSATCLLDTTMTTAAQITGWELVPAFNAMALMKAVSMQPVVAFISASAADFTAYASRDTVNIYNGVCSTEVNHAVVVVGFNYTGPDLKGSYWIIKNSWYPTWGDKGFMYLAMTPDVRGKCGILSTPAMYPVYFPSGQQPARFASDKRGKWKITKVDDLSSSLFSTTLSLSTITNGTFINNIIATALGATCAGMINPCGGGSCYISGGVPRCNCGAMSNMVETTINCTGWYRVMQGDTCPSIWNGANLTMSMFLSINPGVQPSPPCLPGYRLGPCLHHSLLYLSSPLHLSLPCDSLSSICTASLLTSFSLAISPPRSARRPIWWWASRSALTHPS